MLLFTIYKLYKSSITNLSFSRLTNRNLKRLYATKLSLNNRNFLLKDEDDGKLELIKKIKQYDYKIQYSSFVEENLLRIGPLQNLIAVKLYQKEKQRQNEELQSVQPLPVTLKYINEFSAGIDHDPKEETEHTSEQQLIQFPYEDVNVAAVSELNTDSVKVESKVEESDVANAANKEVRKRRAVLGQNHTNWMTDYENYNDSNIEEEYAEDETNIPINYGTPDPNSQISNVPCSGCGALLHCKNESIPGYIPSEIYKNHSKPGGTKLTGIICQRCHFLKYYNVALQVRVSPDDYPKILATIGKKRAMVVLLIDLLDFPCSIWPGIADILSNRIPVVVVGNKVDLLPQDSPRFMQHIKKTLSNSVVEWGFAMSNIQDVCLISAKTGFGVEELITVLHSLHKKQKRDTYIVGCTNVGKSTLFNTLLQSDYCKVQAADLIQRATTSQWPGTTLNLLKFPIARPSGWKQYVRHQRLKSQHKLLFHQQNVLKQMQLNPANNESPSFLGYLERSTLSKDFAAESDLFNMNPNLKTSASVKVGINEHDPQYALSSWCFDTPGVVQPDQIIHLLTTEELMLILPNKLIVPRVFCFKSGKTIFLGGLGRLDYLEGNESIRFVVFCSSDLPITICDLDVADRLYEEFLGTEVFKVPINDGDRLKKWPGLEKGKEIKVKGLNWEIGSADLVLSNAGWITVSGKRGAEYTFRIWTPEKRGAFSRECLLPESIKLRGTRIDRSPAYNISSVFKK